MEHNSDHRPEVDRALIADFVDWYLPRTDLRGNKHALARRSNYSARTIQRVAKSDPSVQAAVLIAISRALGLPPDTLIMIGRHDGQGLVEEGAPADVRRWLEGQVKSGSSGGRAVGQ
jgi:transcriptional regulator with XRE-family HTH domain